MVSPAENTPVPSAAFSASAAPAVSEAVTFETTSPVGPGVTCTPLRFRSRIAVRLPRPRSLSAASWAARGWRPGPARVGRGRGARGGWTQKAVAAPGARGGVLGKGPPAGGPPLPAGFPRFHNPAVDRERDRHRPAARGGRGPAERCRRN